ncbi:hypothetical protein [Parasutterella sp.]
MTLVDLPGVYSLQPCEASCGRRARCSRIHPLRRIFSCRKYR